MSPRSKLIITSIVAGVWPVVQSPVSALIAYAILAVSTGVFLGIGRLIIHSSHPIRCLLVSLLVVGSIGAGLMWLSIASPVGDAIGIRHGCFMAFSALTLTGFHARGLDDRVTTFGIVVLTALMQIGLLTCVSVSIAWTMAIARSARSKSGVTRTTMRFRRYMTHYAYQAVKVLVIIELIGMALLSLSASDGDSPCASLFLALSAISHTGFHFRAGAGMAFNWSTYIILIPLMFAGMAAIVASGRSHVWLRQSVRIWIIGTIALGLSAIGFVNLSSSTHAGGIAYSWSGTNVIGSFITLTRHSGFMTTSIVNVDDSGLVVMMVGMITGGFPGSPIGGIGWFWLLVLFARGWDAKPAQLAMRIIVMYAIIITGGLLFMCWLEPYPPIRLMFESVSAACNSGASLDITADLTPFSQWMMIALMFAGRVGPWILMGVHFRNGLTEQSEQ